MLTVICGKKIIIIFRISVLHKYSNKDFLNFSTPIPTFWNNFRQLHTNTVSVINNVLYMLLVVLMITKTCWSCIVFVLTKTSRSCIVSVFARMTWSCIVLVFTKTSRSCIVLLFTKTCWSCIVLVFNKTSWSCIVLVLTKTSWSYIVLVFTCLLVDRVLWAVSVELHLPVLIFEKNSIGAIGVTFDCGRYVCLYFWMCVSLCVCVRKYI